MVADICHTTGPGRWPDTGVVCCYGVAVSGPGQCTCWEPVYEQEKQPPRTGEPSGVMPAMCGDCAFRPNSPERQGDPDAAADWEALHALVLSGTPFWCHDGLPKPTHFVHPPTGTTVPCPPLHYDPVIVDGTPYRVDGRPGDLCAGWAAMHLKEIGARRG